MPGLTIANAGFIGSLVTPNIQYVGGFSSDVPSLTISLTSLSGGLATEPSIGDLVVVVFGTGVSGGSSSDLSVTGYTQVANLFADAGGDNLEFYVGYKYLTSADTSLTLVNGSSLTSSVAIHVWRNVNQSSPLDVAATTATAADARPAYPSITPITPGALILSAVGIGSDTADAIWTNSNLGNVVSAPDDTETSQESHVGIGSTVWQGGTYNVTGWVSSDTDGSYGSAAVTMALRPA